VLLNFGKIKKPALAAHILSVFICAPSALQIPSEHDEGSLEGRRRPNVKIKHTHFFQPNENPIRGEREKPSSVCADIFADRKKLHADRPTDKRVELLFNCGIRKSGGGDYNGKPADALLKGNL